jgi:hypothetical protein
MAVSLLALRRTARRIGGNIVTVVDQEFEVPEELTLYGKWRTKELAKPILANDDK